MVAICDYNCAMKKCKRLLELGCQKIVNDYFGLGLSDHSLTDDIYWTVAADMCRGILLNQWEQLEFQSECSLRVEQSCCQMIQYIFHFFIMHCNHVSSKIVSISSNNVLYFDAKACLHLITLHPHNTAFDKCILNDLHWCCATELTEWFFCSKPFLKGN